MLLRQLLLASMFALSAFGAVAANSNPPSDCKAGLIGDWRETYEDRRGKFEYLLALLADGKMVLEATKVAPGGETTHVKFDGKWALKSNLITYELPTDDLPDFLDRKLTERVVEVNQEVFRYINRSEYEERMDRTSAAAPNLKPCRAVPAAERKVLTGNGAIELYRFNTTNPDCSSGGSARIRIISPPAHGKVTLASGLEFVAFGKDDERISCNRRTIHAMKLFYRPEEGYSGFESFVVEAKFPGGTTTTVPFELHVVRADDQIDPAYVVESNLKREFFAGIDRSVDGFFDLNSDCSVHAYPIVRVVSKPAHGEVHWENGSGTSYYRDSDGRSDCNKWASWGARVYFKTEAGYSGTDAMVLDVVDGWGNAKRYSYGIDIAPLPAKISGRDPNYPAAARESEVEGEVLAWVEVKEDGSVSKVEIKRSPDMLLSQEVESACREWKFQPPRNRQGVSKGYTAEILVTFKLGDETPSVVSR